MIPNKLKEELEANHVVIVAALSEEIYTQALAGQLSREVTMRLTRNPIPEDVISTFQRPRVF